MPCPLLIFSQSNCLIQVVDTNSYTEWQTVQIQISWLHQKPTDLDLHCLQRQGISRFNRTKVTKIDIRCKIIIKKTCYYGGTCEQSKTNYDKWKKKEYILEFYVEDETSLTLITGFFSSFSSDYKT